MARKHDDHRPERLGEAIKVLRLNRAYLFSDLLAFAVLTEPLEPIFVLAFPASTGAIRVSVLSLSAAKRAFQSAGPQGGD